MNKLKFILLLLVANSLFAQNSNRIFEEVSLVNRKQLEVKVNDGVYLIKFYSSEIVETTFIPSGQKHNTASHAVVLGSTLSDLKLDEDEVSVSFESNDLVVNIQKSPFQISYIYNGKPIISEKKGYKKIKEGEAIQFNLEREEILYGGGARALGMNRRGNRLQLYNRAHYGYETHSELMNYTLPIVLSSNRYMIHFDNAPIGFLDLDSKKDNTLTYETISGRKTYQVIVGETWLDIIDNYTDLTGKQPLPPRWAFGNFSSRFGYHSEAETRATVQAFKEEKIPLDAVIIDIYWFGKDIKGHMGNLEFLRDSFPTPKKMISDLKQQGIKTVLVTEPFILTTSNRWQEAVDKDILAKDSLGAPFKYDFYFGNTGLIDVYDDKAKDWFWNIYKELADMGVKGVWGDLGEPEVHPSDLLHETGTADEVHNTYGHDWAKLIFDGYKKDFPQDRPFILMRAGASGSQRFGLIPWSGDVNRTWGGLQSQTEIALQMGMQGLGYMHSDLGGFAGANLDDELYTRWLQYGVFQPIFRPHAQEEVPSEPVFREPKTKALAKQSIELRYKLLPYNYTLAFENSTTGVSFMRPIFFLEPNNDAQLINANTFLWGNDFLITPVVNPGVSEQEVYFPKDHVWFDFYSEEKIQGGQTISVKTNISSIPTYVKAGAFIPMAKPMQSTDDYEANSIDLHYYHDPSVMESEGQLYNDDGLISEAYKKETFELLRFESEFKNHNLEIEFESKTGSNFNTSTKEIKLIIHNISKRPKQIKVNNEKININWNSDGNIVTIPISWNTSKKLDLNLKLKK
jgi:alpha-glucosidase (family GH31 glycosyl hydrolase)